MTGPERIARMVLLDPSETASGYTPPLAGDKPPPQPHPNSIIGRAAVQIADNCDTERELYDAIDRLRDAAKLLWKEKQNAE